MSGVKDKVEADLAKHVYLIISSKSVFKYLRGWKWNNVRVIER